MEVTSHQSQGTRFRPAKLCFPFSVSASHEASVTFQDICTLLYIPWLVCRLPTVQVHTTRKAGHSVSLRSRVSLWTGLKVKRSKVKRSKGKGVITYQVIESSFRHCSRNSPPMELNKQLLYLKMVYCYCMYTLVFYIFVYN